MVLTVELSMYPLRADYREVIHGFVQRLNGYTGLRVTTSSTSTVIVGEYASVMACLSEMFAWSHAEHGRAAFVAKFLPDYDPD